MPSGKLPSESVRAAAAITGAIIAELTIAVIIPLITAAIREATIGLITRRMVAAIHELILAFTIRPTIQVITGAIIAVTTHTIAAITRLSDVLTGAVLFAATPEEQIAVIKGDTPPEDT
jgi:hypothetical protein